MKDLPVGTNSFSKIIEDGHIYVDKTKYLYNIIKKKLPHFLSRPRRFGKSLLLDTLKEIFLGHRNLFEGLYIYDQPYDWEPHPVIHLDMSTIDYSSPEELNISLLSDLRTFAKKENFDIADNKPVDFFKRLLEDLSAMYGEKRVVVLIDEYDAPILRNIPNSGLAEDIRDALKLFYSVLKSKEALLRFIFITGITRFTKTSIFSDLNNLRDITLHPKYPNVCGFTIDEFDAHFQEHMEDALEPLIKRKSLALGSSVDDLRAKLLEWYDGYSWDGTTKVLNPWSVLNFFDLQKFDNFWFESGTPKFLVDLIKERKMTLDLFDNDSTIITNSLNNVDIDNFEPIPVMFQAGYLTVDQIENEEYLLVLPNLEVKSSLFSNLLSLKTSFKTISKLKAHAEVLHKALSQKNARDIETSFGKFLSSVSLQLHNPKESYYQTLFMFAMTLVNQSVKVEEASGEGFLDASVDIPGIGVFIIEMKYLKAKDQDTEDIVTDDKVTKGKVTKVIMTEEEINDELNKLTLEALRQIDEKNYADKYCTPGKKVYKMALVVYKRTTVKAVIKEIKE
ncbi:MAG: ATP-binding protein [Deltaproteobacteria bacterium]|jgi:hypothetical protein|nr:ATP-binding protein [Deltaproteobacteria bacterium]